MTKAAKKQNVQLTEVEQWFATAPAQTTIHEVCGHDVKAHVHYDEHDASGGTVRVIRCPAAALPLRGGALVFRAVPGATP
jgi:hypothetical protein